MISNIVNLVSVFGSGRVVLVEPGFNTVLGEDDPRTLLDTANLDNFEQEFRDILGESQPFILVLGPGFEARGVGDGPGVRCAGMASIEQLRLFKSSGLTAIVMGRRHGTLVQNARALGIPVVIGGEPC